MTGYLMSGALAAMFALQSASAPAPAPTPATAAVKEAPPKEMKLNGCIARDKALPSDFTFEDNETGGKFRLTGKGLKDFVGHRVEIVGGPPGKKVTFRTGLTPSPNTAGQSSALDPSQLGIANLPGGAADDNGKEPLPEFHVISLRGLDGACQ